MSFIIWLFYFGGTTPAYRHARSNGHDKISSVIDAIIWPAEVGWNMAKKHCKEDKR